MWERAYWYDGKFKKGFIANLYFDKDTGNYKITLQLGKDNKLTIYAKNKEELLRVIIDIQEMAEEFIENIKFLDKVIKKIPPNNE